MKHLNPSYTVFLIITMFFISGCYRDYIQNYTGKPFSDKVYHQGPQVIPGKIQCEYYDLGGEGVAYHDADSINSGSGGLNPSDGSYLNEFRKNESVDISYTKMDDRIIDNNPYNMVEPDSDQLYVGWTEPGEWMNYSIHVQKSGMYKWGLMYTSNHGGSILLALDDSDLSDPVQIPSTFVKEDSVAWRQWHHWNYIVTDTPIKLEEGLHILTLKTVAEGNMNYDYIKFELINE